MKYEGEYYERRLEARRPPDGEWKPQCTPGPCPNHNDDQLLHDWCTAYPQFEWRIAPMSVETLTQGEREDVEYLPGRQPGCPMPDCLACRANVRRGDALAKLLRIHDTQAARIAELEAKYEGPKDHVATELVNRMLAEHPQLKAKIAALEAKVAKATRELYACDRHPQTNVYFAQEALK